MLEIGNKTYKQWPPDDDQSKTRLETYQRNRLLFKGKHQDVYSRVQQWLDREADKTLVYIVCNFAGLLSKVSSDMLFGEPHRFMVGEEGGPEQEQLDRIIRDNGLQLLGFEGALSSSWRGDAILKTRFGKFSDWDERNYAIIEAASPGTFWPILDGDNVRGLKGGVFGWTKQLGKQKYLRIERQLPGLIRNELYRLDGQTIQEQVKLSTFPEYAEMPEEQETGYPGLLFEYIPNWRLDDEFFGISDYADLEGLFDELNNRVSRISRVLDKHESPRLLLPAGMLVEDPRNPGRYYIEKEALEAIEVGEDDPKDLPRYLVWDAQLEAAFKQIDKLLELAFMISETSPDAFGLQNGGVAESGRALKFRLLRLLAKINRKKLYWDHALKNVLHAAQYLEAVHGGGPDPKDVSIQWADGLPQDPYEAAEIEDIRTGRRATTSRKSAISRLDGLQGKQLDSEVATIEEEERATAVPAPMGGLNLGFMREEGEGEA